MKTNIAHDSSKRLNSRVSSMWIKENWRQGNQRKKIYKDEYRLIVFDVSFPFYLEKYVFLIFDKKKEIYRKCVGRYNKFLLIEKHSMDFCIYSFVRSIDGCSYPTSCSLIVWEVSHIKEIRLKSNVERWRWRRGKSLLHFLHLQFF